MVVYAHQRVRFDEAHSFHGEVSGGLRGSPAGSPGSQRSVDDDPLASGPPRVWEAPLAGEGT
jgi:hypothetical protein